MKELERQTRKERIEARLRGCGWEVVPYNRTLLAAHTRHAVCEYPTESGPADYALFYDGQILGVIEAKQLSLGPQNVLIQAQRYARGIAPSPFNFHGFRVPFIYSTNGEIIWFQDLRERNSYSRRISNFHTPQALGEMLQKDFRRPCLWFKENPNKHPKLRYYQIAATEAIEGAIAEGKREIFIAMATGTGKTHTVVSQIYRLMKSGLARWVLFLVDRRALAGRFPKTLIFAVNDLPHISHADRLVRLAREIFGRGDDFVQKITGNPTVDRPLQLIREFRNRPKPGIVVTVDMLSTGVDIPALEFIVFLRPVKSRILFEQMMGRGTRKCDEIAKSHFTVFDCFGGTLLEYFKDVSAFTIDPPVKPTRPIQEIIENIYQNRDREYHTRLLIKRLQRIAKSMSGEAIEQFSRFIPDGDLSKFAKQLPELLVEDLAQTIQILRDPAFQDLLVNYPRAKRSFLVAYETRDEVVSEELIREAGATYGAEEYLEAFMRFVRENKDTIEAVKILLERPSGWSTEALHQLRKALQENNFSEANLRKAYHQELADIISLIKHAARDEPLLTAEERVTRALEKLTQDKTFTEQQRRWLELIKSHLIQSLTIDKSDFERIPAFTRKGGWKAVDKIFEHQLESLLREINREVAAV